MIQQQTSTPDFIPAEQPDFIPDNQGLSPNTRAAMRDMPPFPEAPKGPALVRFLKGAGKTYLGATLNAGPAMGSNLPAITPEEEADYLAKNRTNADYFRNAWNLIFHNKNSSISNIPVNAFNEVIKQPIQAAAEGIRQDPAEGSGSALMNLLLLRAGYKQMRGAQAPEFGAPSQTAEIVQPLTRQPRTTAEVPTATPKAEYKLPNATYLRDDIRSLSQQPPVKQLSQLDRANELLKGIKEHEFLSKVQDELNRPEGQPDVAAEIDARMAELAKKPVDVGGSVKSGPRSVYRYGAQSGDVSFYSKNADYAQEYAITKGGKPSDVSQQTIQLKNPKIVNASDRQMGDPSFESGHIKAAQSAGNDGVIFRNGPDEFYAVFNKQKPSTAQYAYRVRDTGETGVMPKGHAQATMDLGEANTYMEGRGSAQAAPQEMVRVDLSKLNPSEYELIPGPNGKQWVRFKGAVPESYISKVPPARLQKLQQMLAQPKPKALMTEGSDLIEALRQMARAKGAD